MGTQALGEIFHSFLSSSKLSSVFLELSISFRKHCQEKKGKQLVNFDYQNVNSLCSHHHDVNSSCSVFLSSFSINLPAFYHECFSLSSYASVKGSAWRSSTPLTAACGHFQSVCKQDLD